MSSENSAPAVDGNLEAALKDLYDAVSKGNMFPFWATSTTVDHDEVRQLMNTAKAVPYVWSYDRVIEPLLKRSAELVSMADSERRSLILVNPGLAPRRASVTTMYTAYRLNDPHEVMPQLEICGALPVPQRRLPAIISSITKAPATTNWQCIMPQD